MNNQEQEEQFLMAQIFSQDLEDLLRSYQKKVIPEIVMGFLFYTGEYTYLRSGISAKVRKEILTNARRTAKKVAKAMEAKDEAAKAMETQDENE